MENTEKVGNYLIEELNKIPQIKEVRGTGLIIGIEFEQPVKEIRSKLLFDKKVFIEFFVKVEKDWRNRERKLRNFGYQLEHKND